MFLRFEFPDDFLEAFLYSFRVERALFQAVNLVAEFGDFFGQVVNGIVQGTALEVGFIRHCIYFWSADAIRRTGGSYVLYPGNHSKNQRGFHEIIPGLGAYAVSPSKVDDGINDLRAFVVEVVEHLCNRASQRERLAYRTYDIFNTVPKPSENLQALLPEPYNNNRSILPDETFVLIASVDSEERHTWIKKQCLYPISIETGSVVFNVEVVTSKFLLLYSKNELCSGKLWRIPNNGFRSFSKEKLADMGYPFPTGESYLVVDIEVFEPYIF